jgi:hypothetical protein
MFILSVASTAFTGNCCQGGRGQSGSSLKGTEAWDGLQYFFLFVSKFFDSSLCLIIIFNFHLS